MALTSEKVYEGTIEAKDRKSLQLDKEYREMIEGNQRWQKETGGWVVKATYVIDGEDISVEKIVDACQVANLTVAQVIAAADALLAIKLKLE
jgi:hypothetical protein